MLKVDQAALLKFVFEACQMSMSTWVVFKWLLLPMAVCNSPSDWLMNLSIDIVLCVMCGADNGTNLCHFTVFSMDVAFAHHFVAPYIHPSTLHPYISVCGIVYICQ